MEPFPIIRGQAGFANPNALAEYLEVAPITVRRWDQKGPPKAVRLLLQILGRDLSWLGKTWEGMYFDYEGYIRGATRNRLHGGNLRAIENMERLIELQDMRIRELRAADEALEKFRAEVQKAIDAGTERPYRTPVSLKAGFRERGPARNRLRIHLTRRFYW